MSDKRYLGNIITDTPTAPAGPYQDSAASGVWSLAEAFAYNKAGLWPTAGNAAQLGFFASELAGTTNFINKINIATTGNATDVGDLTVARRLGGGGSSSTRGIFAGGYAGSTGTRPNTIDYITMASAGNASDFGDLTYGLTYIGGGVSTETRALFAQGTSDGGSTGTNQIQYVTIATTGNASNFGDRTFSGVGPMGVSSTTRGVFGGGNSAAGFKNVIDYVTIATTGNATDFGDITVARQAGGGASSSTRGIFAGGFSSGADVIEYITISSTGNAIDFGDLTVARYACGGVSSKIRAVFGNGTNALYNGMDYVTISTTGNAATFGELSSGNAWGSLHSCSTAHGGLA